MKKLRYYAGGKRHPEQDEAFIASLNKKKWTAGDSEGWDTCWYTGMPKPAFFKGLSHRQNINHIPGNNSLTIKSRLHDTLSSAQNCQLDDARKARFGFFPKIYDMPGDYHKFHAFAAANPDDKWILKPKNSSRGRGIEVVTDTLAVPSESRWMVQQYLSNPDVIEGRKYVLRLYVLITSIAPLQVYIYHEGLVKLASEPYSLDNLDNPFAHLTNPDINATNEKAEAPVVFYSLEYYRQLLEKRGQDADKLFHQIHDLVTLTVIASREKFRARIERANVNQHACYELLGLDCMIDKNLKPWILECNLSPSLETCTTQGEEADIEAVIKNSMVKDMVNLRSLNNVDDRPVPDDFKTIAGFIQANLDYETAHSGGFQRLYPNPDTVQDYQDFFMPLKSDLLAAKAVLSDYAPPIKYAHSMTPHLVTDKNILAIYDQDKLEFIELTAHEGWVWVKLMSGTSLLETQEDYVTNFTQNNASLDAKTLYELEAFPWDCAARWVEKGYCKFHDLAEVEKAETEHTDPVSATELSPSSLSLRFKGIGFQIECYDADLAEMMVESDNSNAPKGAKSADDIKIDIIRGRGGFHLVQNGQISNRLIKSDVLDALKKRLLRSVISDDFTVALKANSVRGSDSQSVQIIMNPTPKDFRVNVAVTGLLVNLKTQDVEAAVLPLSHSTKTMVEVLPGKKGFNPVKDLSFAEYDEESGKLVPVTGQVKIMNWVVRNGFSKTGTLTANQINILVQIIQQT